MNAICLFDGQTYTCQTPNWPEEKCENAEESRHRNGKCMYLMENNRCDNIKNREVDNGRTGQDEH